MSRLHRTKLSEGEEIIFGPARRASTSMLSVKSEERPGDVTHTSFRTVCITTNRVIVESGDSVITLPNHDVHKVLVQRKLDKKQNLVSFNILQLRTRRGTTVKIEIFDILPAKEPRLLELFPNAKISDSRGMAGLLERFLGS